jgi:hypothetical protein
VLVLGLVAAGTGSVGAAAWHHTAPDDTLTIDGMSPGDLVLRVGLVDSYWQADSPANVSVYADGRVVVADEDERLGYATFVIDAAQLGELLHLAAMTAPFDDVDYGGVMVTDVGSKRVELHSDQGDSVVTVWALEFDDGLTADQRESRQRLLSLVEAMESLAGDTSVHVEPLAPFVSDDVTIVLRPVLPGMSPEGPTPPWPLEGLPLNVYADGGFHYLCFAVPSSVVTGLPDEVDGEYLWAPPTNLDAAAPAALAASVTAVLPGSKPCEDYSPVEDTRPLTPDEVANPPHDWTSPWPQGVRTTTQPIEEWMALDTLARTVLPAELGGSWGWNRWSWFEYRFAATELDGRRVIDIRATCTEYVEDEEPACTIDARFDTATGELLEFAAA